MVSNKERSLPEILQSVDVTLDKYLECLQVSLLGTTVILQCDPFDVNINNYNINCISLWQANMDLQYLAKAYSAIMYLCSYMLKAECGMSELLMRIAREYKDKDLKEQMKQIASAFIGKCEVSIHESVM